MTITKEMRALLSLSAELQRQKTVDAMLDRLVERTAEILHADHVSVHFLDASRTSLVRHARAGNPFHENGTYEFVNGEGLIGWVAKRAAPLRVDKAEDDDRFKKRADQKKKIGAFVAVPLVECGECIGVISAVSADEGHFTQDHEDMLLLIGGYCVPYLRYVRLSRLMNPDPVTGALPSTRLDEVFPKEDKGNETLSVALVDIDDFGRAAKAAEKQGKTTADEILRTVALAIGGVLRQGDAMVRYGDDEFLIVLRGCELKAASRLAERLRGRVESDVRLAAKDAPHLTVSIGVAERKRDEVRRALLKRVELGVASAKTKGGNRVQVVKI